MDETRKRQPETDPSPTPRPDLCDAPRPRGPLSGRRTALRRMGAIGCAGINRILDRIPPGRWLHRRVQETLSFTDVDVALNRGGAGLHGLRIAFLSDLHAGSFMDELDLCRIFEKVAAVEPHMVCLGGDLINTRERELLLYRRPLEILSPPLGIFAVPGNHDHFWGRDLGLWDTFLREQGVRVVINRGERVTWRGANLWVAGVDDLTEGDPRLHHALDGREDDEPTLLLSHHPDYFFEASQMNVDLTLSGHTHGGQIRLFGWSAIRHSRLGYHHGLFEEQGCRLYVGRGVGVTVLPLRIGAPPEIPLLRFVVEGGSL